MEYLTHGVSSYPHTFDTRHILTMKHFLTDCQTAQSIRSQLKLPNDPRKRLGEQCSVVPLIKYL